MVTNGLGAMDADGHCPAMLDEWDDVIVRTTRVALAAAHLDHDPTNNRLRNLRALCQRCHVLQDRDAHWRRRLLTLRMRNAIGNLFLGLYQT
jgi:hypothetical protein